MKKVMHGDKIKATIEKQGDKEQAEPEALIEPMLTRFIAKVRFNKDKKLQVLVDHPSINQPIGAQQAKSVKEELQEGDWVVANLKPIHYVTIAFSTPQLINLFAELTMN